jgi:hypothetical protein
MAEAATVTVGSTATRLVGTGAPVRGGQRVLVRNSHASDALIVGGSNALTAANGYGIPAGQSLDLGYIAPGEIIWAIRGGAADIGAQVLVLAS